jgi:hypothetical protein
MYNENLVVKRKIGGKFASEGCIRPVYVQGTYCMRVGPAPIGPTALIGACSADSGRLGSIAPIRPMRLLPPPVKY